MTYEELLFSQEWFDKCQRIVSRDMYKCQVCGKIGAHSETFLTFKNIQEIDSFLGRELLGNKVFSEFIDNFNITDNSFYQFNRLPLKCKKESNKRHMYSAWLYEQEASEKKPIFGCILNNLSYDFIVDRIIDNYIAKACFRQLEHGSYAQIVFEKSISGDITVIIENKYDRTNINVVNDNIVHCCRFNYVINWDDLISYPQIPSLNVHHEYYLEGKKPWEYDDSALVTLCQDCHQKRHEKEEIPVYKSIKLGNPDYSIGKCHRCGGSGFIPQYMHYCNGICFMCHGEGTKIVW